MTSEERVMHRMRQQHGIISRSQAMSYGMTSAQIVHRTNTRQWVRAAPGVYRHASSEATRMASLLALCLAHKAWASHRSAAAVWGIVGYPLDRYELVVAARRTPIIRGAKVHTSSQMDLARPMVRQAIPCTGLARTVLDLASVVNRKRLDHTIDSLLRDRRLRLSDLYDVLVLHARRGRDGCAALRAALDARLDDGSVPLSEWSRMVSDLLVNAGIAAPVMEHQVLGPDGRLVAQVDLAYPDRRLAIELDSVRWHHNLDSFGSDRQRRNRLLLTGWNVLNFTWDDYARRPDELCTQVAAAINSTRRNLQRFS